jgi:hypothetical protein
VQIDLTSPESMGMDVTEYQELRELAQEGLDVVRDAPIERQAVMLEVAAFADFLLERIPQMRQEWDARREELVAEGRLPARRPGGEWR